MSVSSPPTTRHPLPGAAPHVVDAASHATADGTRRLAERFRHRFAADFYRAIPGCGTAEGLTAGSIGIGTYLGACTDDEDARYVETIGAALAAGCNVIDTAINYRCQRSERAVGRALAAAIERGVVRRDEVVVCTKGGFVALDGAPPPTRDEYDAYLRRELFATGVIGEHDLARGGHTLAPGFLAYQIARSRRNLGVATIDVYYLHDPERQLEAMEREAFRGVLRRAIEALEAAVTRGDIARWGVASWRGMRVAPGARGHLSLAEVLEAAHDVAGASHHLAVLQAPINLAMPDVVRTPTQPATAHDGSATLVPLLKAAHAHRLPIVASSPLMEGQLTAGLPEIVREQFRACDTDAQRAISVARDLPGVCTTLVGMRSTAHLRENLRVAR